ncbi:MAG: tRNA lysidine(34) synthetase TilS, partial [Candidatus Aminicenantes bacterium]|nr:tRNA lysidine(34) synthetase TilS [Candidatus Aminicenantes bacterium]
VFLDLGKLKLPLLVRNRSEGDRYQPLGAPGQKKLKEIMRAKGIPLSERERLPVFLSGDKIIWILGLPVSKKFKVEKGTSDIFAIKKL